ncbi:hypothetical protein FOVG_16167 [Fusarium oxysporum f. sp. pisi HDV247]|uniref:NAD(P)-binding protein n=1 Tax=Fusarium oxysporum f. sp. pisi HDV247 TaxID=1080344 RepID=W9NIR9_FUSOX|nr:hypothetical protein FOVG_16167 [Fusarium oxysporum f. sp. pisi HDV247]
MPSYLLTGASRCLGFGFIQVVSINPNNSLVRNKAATDKKLAEELGSPNNGAFEAVSEIAEGSLDYVISNAGLIALWSQWDAVDLLVKDPEQLVKHLQDSFNVNKVIAISSGMSDIDFIRQFEIEAAPAYAISTAGTSVLTAKFAARYAKEGVLFMSICPGSVDSGFEGELTEEQKEKVTKLGSKFVNYAPRFRGPSTPVDSVKAVLKVINEAFFEKGSSGALVSMFGNKQWM